MLHTLTFCNISDGEKFVTCMVCHKTDCGCEVSGFCTVAVEVLVLLGGGTTVVVARFQAFALVHLRSWIFWEMILRHWLIGDVVISGQCSDHIFRR